MVFFTAETQRAFEGICMKKSTFGNFIAAAGVILAISYPVLAISTGFRALFQLFEREAVNAPVLTLIGALLYTVATVGFVKQPRPDGLPGRFFKRIPVKQGWRISVGALIIETIFTVVVGVLSYTHPELIGRNVWQFFGKDYGYFPLIQPLLGVAWLFHPYTLRSYGIRG